MTTDDWQTWRVSVPDHVLVQLVGEQSALLHLETESYFGLDPVGVSIWEAMEVSDTLGAAHTALLDRYDVSSQKLSADLVKLAGDLESHGLLTIDR